MHANMKTYLSVCLYIHLMIGWKAVARRWVCFMALHAVVVPSLSYVGVGLQLPPGNPCPLGSHVGEETQDQGIHWAQ